ncbi:peptide-methionine (S)-S-oxide reductase [Devosia enhydra]|uniref:Peptide methionine sulfoxide reductase MsrA n=1 Tax=Devosia enhydra TaxID=665118 RepID=A0A1K2HVK3_9HYPH|nr:peptide-methionine (S)-S-oxide reductase MsrA [Devosia enhydra]SFZ82755.1 peptide-methionine (S)-S-oxide reductase [Devosia enhydra]
MRISNQVFTLALAVALSWAPALPAAAQQTATAVFAGGCFWCVESDFDKVQGVTATVSGYIGGEAATATYDTVTRDKTTGHYEAVEVTYDPTVTSYDKLLTVFWHSVDPFDAEGQFCDKGPSYRTGIFTASPDETAAAEASKEAVKAELGRTPATAIVEGKTFYRAEDYHQDFYINNAAHYTSYRFFCGRDARLREIWGDKALLGTKDNPAS